MDRMPSLGPLYRAAALRRGVAKDPVLPSREVTLDGVTVDPAHLAGYNRVCGFRLRDELPATYPHVVAFPLAMTLMTAPDFPFPLLGLIHVANRIELLRPVRFSSPLSFRVRAEALRPHDRGTQLDVVTTAAVDGEVVWRDTSTYLRRTSSGSSGGSSGGGSAGGSATGAADSGAAGGASAGAPAPNAVWRVPRRVGTDYAAVSGDRNPIHTSRLLAKVFGFPRTIAHGMWTKARCLAALEGRLPDTYTVAVAFKLPVLLPATVGFSATVPGDRQRDGQRDGSGDGWDFGVHDRRSGRPHLSGTVR
ncbi:MaoC/PaaZ C-terminal domain-containing protein [Dactylosporangium sp. NPDC050688]|uniref:MaoC/PaaZ C-terminal domain-containing protein n=1 Tax=Dactylosporangium sp. NPDC050688 TaxID=3157217 RepID=UPI0033E34203